MLEDLIELATEGGTVSSLTGSTNIPQPNAMFVHNPRAILVILKLLSECEEELQLRMFTRLLKIINFCIKDDMGQQKFLLRNKELLVTHDAVKYIYEIYHDILTDPYESELKKLIQQMVIELGTHRLSPPELHHILHIARDTSQRTRSLMQFLGEIFFILYSLFFLGFLAFFSFMVFVFLCLCVVWFWFGGFEIGCAGFVLCTLRRCGCTRVAPVSKKLIVVFGFKMGEMQHLFGGFAFSRSFCIHV